MAFDLPNLYHPDEPLNLSLGVRMADTHSVNAHSFAYPSLMYDITATIRAIENLVAYTRPNAGIVEQNLGTGHTTDPHLFIAVRLVVLMVSVALCAITWITVSWITRRWWAATLAALLPAVSPLMAVNGIIVTPDTYSAFFTGAALLAALLVLRSGRLINYLLAGVTVGLAAGAKYNAALVAVAVVVAHVLRNGRRPLRATTRLLAAAGTAIVTFLVITPGAALSPHDFYSQATAQLHLYRTGHAGNSGSSYLFYLSVLFHDDFLWIGAGLAAIAGIFTRWRNETLVVTVFSVGYFILIGSQVVHFSRDVLPLIPALAILFGIGAAALSTVQLADLPVRLHNSRLPAATGAAVAVACLLVPTFASVHQVSALDNPARSDTLRWLDSHVPAGATIVIESYGPWVPGSRYHVIEVPYLLETTVPPDAAALVLTKSGSGRFLEKPGTFPAQTAAYRRLRNNWRQAAFFTGGPWNAVLTPRK